ncbi:MAG: Rrf2 family transcriptional regulator [Pirellulales bacterium]|nr:Rrf2 family transcriptional regulator [Pirellulales bacterium]
MKLSRTVSYALQATLQLAQVGTNEPVPCSQLAAEGKMPERFLLQILRNLVAHRILQSTRGVEGGYALERTPEEISLLEVIEAIEGPLSTALPVCEGLPEKSRLKLEKSLSEITNLARRQLQSVTLADLMPEPMAVTQAQAAEIPAGSRLAGGKSLVRGQAAKST